MITALGAAVAVVFTAGVAVVVLGVAGTEAGGDATTPTVAWRRHGRGLALATAGLVLGWAATGWLAAGGILAVVAVVAPGLVEARRLRVERLELTEALASWAEMLRDTIASHAGLREAIGVSAEVAPEPIAEAVRRLSVRSEHDSLSSGLRRFADEVADPVGDLIVAALIVAADGQARNLPALLSEIATSARSEAHMRQRVETGRARTYSSSRALVAITFALSMSLLVLAPTFMAPYSSPWGQVVLLLIALLFGSGVWGLVVLGRPAHTPRLLAGVADHDRGAAR